MSDYAVRLVAASRDLTELRLGVSTRGALALVKAARSMAATQGRPFVVADDIKAIAPTALAHRMLLAPQAELRGARTSVLVEQLLDTVDSPVPIRSGR